MPTDTEELDTTTDGAAPSLRDALTSAFDANSSLRRYAPAAERASFLNPRCANSASVTALSLASAWTVA